MAKTTTAEPGWHLFARSVRVTKRCSGCDARSHQPYQHDWRWLIRVARGEKFGRCTVRLCAACRRRPERVRASLDEADARIQSKLREMTGRTVLPEPVATRRDVPEACEKCGAVALRELHDRWLTLFDCPACGWVAHVMTGKELVL